MLGRREFTRRVALIVLLGLGISGPVFVYPAFAGAFSLTEPLADPAQEARARALSKEFRCLVCQNQSIADSDAGLAEDLRRLVRERIAAGDTDVEVRDFFVARYGEWILLDPPLNRGTALLWLGPALVILIGGFGVGLYLRGQRRSRVAEAPLSAQEANKLASALSPDDPA
jgi:cytochrome c-type biogenesis protein CcmH